MNRRAGNATRYDTVANHVEFLNMVTYRTADVSRATPPVCSWLSKATRSFSMTGPGLPVTGLGLP